MRHAPSIDCSQRNNIRLNLIVKMYCPKICSAEDIGCFGRSTNNLVPLGPISAMSYLEAYEHLELADLASN